MANVVWDQLDPEKQRELEALQLDREVEMLDLGASRYWKHQEGDGKPEESFIHEAGLYLLPAIEQVRQEISDTYTNGKRVPSWAPAFMWLSNEHIIVLLLRALLPASTQYGMMDQLEGAQGVKPWDIMQQSASRDLAQSIWQLSQYHQARRTFADQWDFQSKYIKNWNKRQQLRFTRKVMDISKLGGEARLSLGIRLLQIAEQAGICERRVVKQYKDKKFKTLTVYGLKPEIMRELHSRHDLLQWLRPKWGPMVAPPNDWVQDHETGQWQGGYYMPGMAMRFVRPATPGYESEGITKPGDTCVEAVNTAQQTPFAVNNYILETMRLVFEQNLELGDTPRSKEDEFDFQRFTGVERDDEGRVTPQFKEHLQTREAAHGSWHKGEADRLRMIERLALADQMRKYPAFWHVLTLDFRTRMYTSTEMLSPQGCDLDKGMVLFATKMKQTDRGRWWLKVHIANNFGVDKVSFEERVAWVDEHELELRASVEDPISNTFWTTADAKHKWQALAGCHDLYVEPEWTSVPVQMDGSCNGIQHWSAMGRDEIGATATNLIDNDVPNDLYSEVKIELQNILSDRDDEWSDRWLPHVTRKLAKRPCMTYPYGVTRNGIQKALVYDGFCNWLTPDELQQGAGFITDRLLTAIPNVVYSSHHYMVWIKEVARIITRGGTVMRWPTPSGTIVDHGYYELETKTLEVNNQRIQFSLPTKGVPVIDANAAKNGIAPNFVHSMDATHMQLSIVDMADEGIHSFSMIHDSYGCHACMVDRMQRSIRRQFVLMYELFDPIVEFAMKMAEETTDSLPEMPTRGCLDLTQVINARYFFS